MHTPSKWKRNYTGILRFLSKNPSSLPNKFLFQKSETICVASRKYYVSRTWPLTASSVKMKPNKKRECGGGSAVLKPCVISRQNHEFQSRCLISHSWYGKVRNASLYVWKQEGRKARNEVYTPSPLKQTLDHSGVTTWCNDFKLEI